MTRKPDQDAVGAAASAGRAQRDSVPASRSPSPKRNRAAAPAPRRNTTRKSPVAHADADGDARCCRRYDRCCRRVERCCLRY